MQSTYYISLIILWSMMIGACETSKDQKVTNIDLKSHKMDDVETTKAYVETKNAAVINAFERKRERTRNKLDRLKIKIQAEKADVSEQLSKDIDQMEQEHHKITQDLRKLKEATDTTFMNLKKRVEKSYKTLNESIIKTQKSISK